MRQFKMDENIFDRYNLFRLFRGRWSVNTTDQNILVRGKYLIKP